MQQIFRGKMPSPQSNASVRQDNTCPRDEARGVAGHVVYNRQLPSLDITCLVMANPHRARRFYPVARLHFAIDWANLIIFIS